MNDASSTQMPVLTAGGALVVFSGSGAATLLISMNV